MGLLEIQSVIKDFSSMNGMFEKTFRLDKRQVVGFDGKNKNNKAIGRWMISEVIS